MQRVLLCALLLVATCCLSPTLCSNGVTPGSVHDEPATSTHVVVWRLNVPGTASRFLFKALTNAVGGTLQLTLGCETDVQPTCLNGHIRKDRFGVSNFAATADYSVQLSKQRHHENYDQLLRRLNKEANSHQTLQGITMLRDPATHFWRSFHKKTNHPQPHKRVFQFAASWRHRNLTQYLDSDVPFDVYLETAFWRWNPFTRALAGNYSNGNLVETLNSGFGALHPSDESLTHFDDITLAQAVEINDAVLRNETPDILHLVCCAVWSLDVHARCACDLINSFVAFCIRPKPVCNSSPSLGSSRKWTHRCNSLLTHSASTVGCWPLVTPGVGGVLQICHKMHSCP